MPLSVGSRLGPYEILAPIGAGGMGEVYKARDTRLERNVAIKILPESVAHDSQFNVRFEREARAISQLSHPNICTLFDVGDNYLVMELLDGETLADRIARGPLPLSDLLPVGVQIAEALGRAHRAGIVHRDLKPGNVMLTKSGAKLLDFGLAKSRPSVLGFESSVMETTRRPLTEEGTIVGTFQYMAPEQLEGEEADARTDIFALGCVLYEMATGNRPFVGKTKTSLIAAIVSGQPRPLREMQPLTSPVFEHVITRCLEKDPDSRWQSAQDVAEELRWIAGGEAGAIQGVRRSAWPLIAMSAALALVIGAVAGGWTAWRRQPPAAVIYSEINAPQGTTFSFDTSAAALSPDGRMLAMVARPPNGAATIWVRSLESPVARPLKGTDDAMFPFWSPDSQRIGFFADGKLKRIDLTSGAPDTLADAPTPRGGSWGAGDTIIFAPSPASGLYAVSAGSSPRPVTEPNVARGDTSHRFPSFLPDGRHFLYYIQGAYDIGNVVVGSLDSKETRTVTRADAAPIFAPPDHVLFVRDGALRVQRFDVERLVLTGEAVPIAEHVQFSSTINFANVSASSNGLLSYVAGASATMSNITFFDAHGKELSTVGTPADQLDPRLAPDGHAVAVSRAEAMGTTDIWICDLRRNVPMRLTFSPANEFAPAWSPDSKSIAFTSFDKRPGDILTKRVDGAGPGEVVYADRRRKIVTDWSPDGNYIIYNVLTPGVQWDVEAYSLRDRKVIPLVHGPSAETLGQISPDGRWLAFVSAESGKPEVFVQQFPTGSDRWQISGGGGTMPRWRRDGRELYYSAPDRRMMAAAVHPGSTFVADAPRTMFASRIRLLTGVTRSQYDVSADGRFLMNITASDAEHPTPVTLVQNWAARFRGARN